MVAMTTGSRSLFNPHSSRPAELFRSDFISAMKLPDTHSLEPSSFVEIKEPWRTEWEIGVQVCVSPDSLPKPCVRSSGMSTSDELTGSERDSAFAFPENYISEEIEEERGKVDYDVDELDIIWADLVTKKRKFKGITEDMLKKCIIFLEKKCFDNMIKAISTEESLKIEYDDSVVCDICRDPEREDSNEMVFCDSCNICVHQACYGIQSIPKGSWICKPCSSQQGQAPCVLCPNRSGAMKKIKPGPGWAHMSCALWIPEVRVGNVEKMEPVTNIESVPMSRWNLICCVCRKREGACIQCCYPKCVAAYHVTCGFRNGLEMKTTLVSGRIEHESYCPRHTTLRATPSKLLAPYSDSQSSSQLQEIEDRFYNYVAVEDLAKEMKYSMPLATVMYNYWKMKRKSLHNHPLVKGLHINISAHRSAVLSIDYATKSLFDDDISFMSLIDTRRNLEKARNLVYMVQRRERLKRQLIATNKDIWQHDLKLLEAKKPDTPLCLKRLGIKTEKVDRLDKLRSISEENGMIPVINDAVVEGDNEETRIFRKRTLRSHSTSDELPSKSCHVDEDHCTGPANNGRVSPAFYSTTKSS